MSEEPTVTQQAVLDGDIAHDPHAEHVPTYKRQATLWWAMIAVPVVVGIGIAVGRLAGSGEGNPWFETLVKPDIYPPGWAFGVAWTILYALMGFAVALVIASDRKGYKVPALVTFAIQFAVNLAWSPIFFGAEMIGVAFFWIVALIPLVIATIAFFARVSRLAALLLVPYLAWIAFAATLNLRFWQLN